MKSTILVPALALVCCAGPAIPAVSGEDVRSERGHRATDEVAAGDIDRLFELVRHAGDVT